MTAEIKCLFAPPNGNIAQGFLPVLISNYDISNHWRTFTSLPVRKYGMTLPRSTFVDYYTYDISCLCTSHEADAIVNEQPSYRRFHLKTITVEKKFSEVYFDVVWYSILEGTLLEYDTLDRCTTAHQKNTCAWLIFHPSLVTLHHLIFKNFKNDFSCAMHVLH